jgi:predicted outer membrane repeat protein
MTECTIAENGRGGTITSSGVFVFDAALVQVRDCEVVRNTGELGGGFHIGRSSASGLTMNVEGCLVADNKATLSTGGGGGVHCRGTTLNVRFENCRFRGNRTSGRGGAIYVHDPGVSFVRCTIEENESGMDGGGVSVFTANRAIDSVAVFRSCLVARNKAGGLGGGFYISASAPAVLNCTIVDNEAASSGGGVASSSALNVGPPVGAPVYRPATIANCVLASNRAAEGTALCHTHQDFTTVPPPPEFAHSAYRAGETWRTSARTGGLTDLPVPAGAAAVTDPGFEAAATGNYRLTAGSPLIDRGTDTHVAFGDLDLDGQARISGTSVDIGAFERP